MKVDVVELERHFAKVRAVDGITFSFSSGSTFAFVGPNGAGKTTTMRVMATLDLPTAGDVFYDGVSAKEYPDRVRRLVGFVPDSLPTQSDITVEEYLDFYARAYGLRGAARTEALEAVVDFTGVGPLREKLVAALSKGMKQRVSLGRALIHDPEVLILDEPAAGLDPRARIELRELLRLLTTRGKAILVSSHILTELTEIADGVVIIECGKLLETGAIADVADRQNDGIRTVAVRTLDSLEKLRNALLESPRVEGVQLIDNEIHAQVRGDDESSADLLSGLIRNGNRICEFRGIETDLEDIFMKITRGEVQ